MDRPLLLVVIPALIAALAALAGVWLSSRTSEKTQASAQRAALDQQKQSFQQQQTLADRNELRTVLDQAAGTLDMMITDLDRMWALWVETSHRASYEEFRTARDQWNKLNLRLGLRLSLESAVLHFFRSSGVTAFCAAFRMNRFHPTKNEARRVRAFNRPCD
jgi:type II secretory pathway pseudopilin PulG